MTKQDSATEQHTSKQKTTGKTVSKREDLPKWEPTPLSEKEELRREYKKYYGFKPCDKSTAELRRVVTAARQKREDLRRPPTSETTSLGTMGDIVPNR